ncbi:hypothetical protein MUP01_13095 [Candidatus Bathyarchaeota archaeon]|nr:hypothetical protein [Candidatus Bathyarchaeota archaeon]
MKYTLKLQDAAESEISDDTWPEEESHIFSNPSTVSINTGLLSEKLGFLLSVKNLLAKLNE